MIRHGFEKTKNGGIFLEESDSQDQGVVGATQLLYWQAQRLRVQATKTIPYQTHPLPYPLG